MSSPSAADWIDVTAALVQHTDYNANCAFGRVLITFDPARRNDMFFLDQMHSRVTALRGKRSLTPDEQTALDLTSAPPDKPRCQPYPLPASVTDGVPVYLCERPIFFNRLPNGADSLQYSGRELILLPCRAKRQGGIELLPYTVKDLHRRE